MEVGRNRERCVGRFRTSDARNVQEVNSPASGWLRRRLTLGGEAGGAGEGGSCGRGTRGGSRDEGKELTRRGVLSQIELHEARI